MQTHKHTNTQTTHILARTNTHTHTHTHTHTMTHKHAHTHNDTQTRTRIQTQTNPQKQRQTFNTNRPKHTRSAAVSFKVLFLLKNKRRKCQQNYVLLQCERLHVKILNYKHWRVAGRVHEYHINNNLNKCCSHTYTCLWPLCYRARSTRFSELKACTCETNQFQNTRVLISACLQAAFADKRRHGTRKLTQEVATRTFTAQFTWLVYVNDKFWSQTEMFSDRYNVIDDLKSSTAFRSSKKTCARTFCWLVKPCAVDRSNQRMNVNLR